MQAYLKFKEANEELYEVNINKNEESILSRIFFSITYAYLNFVVFIKKCFNIITVKEIYSGLIFILPISNNNMCLENFSNKRLKDIYINIKLKKCIPKVKKIMKKYDISSLILSEDLQKNEEFMKKICPENDMQKQIHILDGKGLMPYLIKEIFEFIMQKQYKYISLEDIYILVKEDIASYKENIAFLSQHFKTINIVTPCIESYQRLANSLQVKYGAMVTVTNNKKKSLRKAKWIVNFDLKNEEIKKYTIYRNATIIYVENNDVYKWNGFDGIHVCKSGIDTSNEFKDYFMQKHLLNQCPITVLYESTIAKNKSIYEVKKQMEKDKVKITKLYGIRGLLSNKELERSG